MLRFDRPLAKCPYATVVMRAHEASKCCFNRPLAKCPYATLISWIAKHYDGGFNRPLAKCPYATMARKADKPITLYMVSIAHSRNAPMQQHW